MMPSDPIKAQDTKLKMRIAKLGSNHPNYGKPRSEITRNKIRLSNKGKPKTDEHKHKLSISWKTRPAVTQKTKDRMCLTRRGMVETPENIKLLYELRNEKIQLKQMRLQTLENKKNERLNKIKPPRKTHHTPESIAKMRGRVVSEETKRKQSDALKGRQIPYNTILKIREHSIGGFWYGNVRYGGKKYCDLWNDDLLIRIRAYWGDVSVLSGKTKKENSKREQQMSCHHVYYQEKACCVWDEDVQGYYAMINIGTNKKPVMHKHYIKGDPNKFVTLTAKEHGKTNTNKLYWIERFENKIKEQGGKCYYTKEDWEEINDDGKRNNYFFNR